MEYLEHLVGMPQPTDAHVFVFGNLQAALRLRLRLHGETTISHLRWHVSVKHHDERKPKRKRKPFPFVNA